MNFCLNCKSFNISFIHSVSSKCDLLVINIYAICLKKMLIEKIAESFKYLLN